MLFYLHGGFISLCGFDFLSIDKNSISTHWLSLLVSLPFLALHLIASVWFKNKSLLKMIFIFKKRSLSRLWYCAQHSPSSVGVQLLFSVLSKYQIDYEDFTNLLSFLLDSLSFSDIYSFMISLSIRVRPVELDKMGISWDELYARY